VERRPLRKARSVWIAGFDEVREIFVHGLRHIVVIGRPRIDLVRSEIAHRVLDLGGMDSAARPRPRIRRLSPRNAAGESCRRVTHLRSHLWTRAGVKVVPGWLPSRPGSKIQPFPGAVADEAVACKILGCVHDFGIGCCRVEFEHLFSLVTIEPLKSLPVVVYCRRLAPEDPKMPTLLRV